MNGVALLLAEAGLYFGVMAALFRARGALGTGVFVCALGVMHFLETYLAAVFFIELPFGLISPGSTVLFSGKLVMVLLLYIKEDAEAVRQPVYGLLIGNMLIVALCLLLRYQDPVAVGATPPDLAFVDQMGVLMVWGTLLLFVDSIMIVLLYEWLGGILARHQTLRIFASAVLVLSFDQLAFFAVLHLVTGVPLAALFGGWAAKMGAAVVYSAMVGAYLHLFEARGGEGEPRRMADLFDLLTYRHRHAVLLRDARPDPATGALAPRYLAVLGEARFRRAQSSGRPLGVMMVEVSGSKDLEGDAERMRRVAEALNFSLRSEDLVFRYGASRFVLLLDGVTPELLGRLADRLPSQVPDLAAAGCAGMSPGRPAGSTGVSDFAELLRRAEAGLCQAKGGSMLGQEHPSPVWRAYPA
ncbi:diguanylate cyclase domain-containing protein [Roseomonas chloroacetimidivorans]|jgi:GGDEF domain-containing protein|uniref:diguanylate cyclase domain-containing protein n=1 Tax=Roseomonas chloroacetimidivorans TaxID=1766656 RepID=UPI003C7640C3